MAAKEISITGARIRELYEMNGYSQQTFAEFLGISPAHLRRYLNAPSQTIRSDLLIVMAKRFRVSVDYLLVLTPVTKNNHEMEQLHLTEAACEKLIRGEVSGDTDIDLPLRFRFPPGPLLLHIHGEQVSWNRHIWVFAPI